MEREACYLKKHKWQSEKGILGIKRMIILISSEFSDRSGSSLNTKAKKKKREEWESDSSEDDFDESDYVIDDDDDDVIEIKKTTPGDRKQRMEKSANISDLNSTNASVDESFAHSGDGNMGKFHEKMDDLFVNEKPSGSTAKSKDDKIKKAKSKKEATPKA
ncbi:unnamed protein product, partial [Onchocerca flexuosa]|uniref:NUC153 domain-containing protein n=1 Tax=Onchocerca flexuosa TaxID=387005 RepID=A0A183HX79_9BILA